MGPRVEKGGNDLDKGDIMFGGSSVHRVYGLLQGDELFITSLNLILKFWEEMRLKRKQYHITVTLKRWFKVEIGNK